MRRRDCIYIALSVIILLSAFSTSQAQDFSGVPGVVIDYVELSYPGWPWFPSAPNAFVADPEIKVLTNGDYIASWALSGSGTSCDTSGETWTFYSSDKGTNWTQLGAKKDEILRGSFFEYDGAIYLIGQHHEGGKLVILKTTDQGTNWTHSGQFTPDGPATPNNPTIYNGKVWLAAHKDSLFAPLSSNLMVDASWTRANGFPDSSTNWISEGYFMGEGQLLCSPGHGITVMPKTRDLPLSGLGIVETNSGSVSFAPSNDFVSVAGAEKKFGGGYDPVSKKFYILSNPVLPCHEGCGIDPNMIRNTLAVMSSDDTRNWKVEKLLLYSNKEQQEGFGYPQFDFDGNNMVVMTRTAMVIPGEQEPWEGRGGHDSNCLNFHKWKNFRTEEPNHYLVISNNSVLRFEQTQHQDAPLEDFTLGSSFAGAPLSSPIKLGQDTNGDVYIEESGGRILRFDASGNFLETVVSAPIALGSGPLDVDQPTDGSATWMLSGSDDWFDTVNWYYWNRPDTDADIAVFGSALTGNRTITVNQPYELAGFRFLTSYDCTFSGDGFFTLSSCTGTAILVALECSPNILIGTTLGSDAMFTIGASEQLNMNGMNLGGNTLTLDGTGTIEIANSAFTMGGGSLLIDRTELTITNSQALFDGTVEFKAPAGFAPELDDTFQILDGDLDTNMFENLVLPTLEDGLGWDTSTLYSNGTIKVAERCPTNWMDAHGLPVDGSEDFEDTDHDGMDNYSEWASGTNPTNPASVFNITNSIAATGFRLNWVSITGKTYRVDISTNLLDVPMFQPLYSGIVGEAGLTELIHTNPPSHPSVFYRTVIE